MSLCVGNEPMTLLVLTCNQCRTRGGPRLGSELSLMLEIRSKMALPPSTFGAGPVREEDWPLVSSQWSLGNHAVGGLGGAPGRS